MIIITLDDMSFIFDTLDMSKKGVRLIDELESRARLLHLLRQLLRQRADRNYYWRPVGGGWSVLMCGGQMAWEIQDLFYKQEATMYLH